MHIRESNKFSQAKHAQQALLAGRLEGKRVLPGEEDKERGLCFKAHYYQPGCEPVQVLVERLQDILECRPHV